MNWKEPVLLVPAIMLVCPLLDAYTLFGDYAAPDTTGRSMCSLRPLTYFGSFLFPNDWSQFVSDYCASFPREPAISILALMLKLSLVALLLVLTIAMVPLREEKGTLENSGSRSSGDKRATSGAGWIPIILMFSLPLVIFWWWLIGSKSPQDFHTALINKVYEDIYLLAFYVGGIILTAAACEAILLPVLRRSFPNQDWIKPQ